MRIRKVSQPTPIVPGTAQITDTYSTSTDDGYSCNYINERDTLSTSEQVIGKWIDGKTIYRKVLPVDIASVFGSGTATAGASSTFGHGISNLGLVLDLKISWVDTAGGNNRTRFIPANYYGSTDWAIQATVNSTSVVVEEGKDVLNRIRSYGQNMYAIIEYTKSS